MLRNLIKKMNCLKTLLNTRTYQTLQTWTRHKSSIEVQIPVPWGHVGGKWWGDTNQRPLLSIHGWQDNCGSFDRLIPLLPETVSVLAVDLPGHGTSSQLPHGIPYDVFNTVMTFRRIQRHYNWPRVSFLSHSMGSMLSFLFAAWFPQDTELLIGIDAISPIGYDYDVLQHEFGKKLDDAIRFDDANMAMAMGEEPPAYPYDELMDKFVNSFSPGSCPKEFAHCILDRGIRRASSDPQRWYFSRDVRTKSRVFPKFLHKDLVEMARNVTCAFMNIKVIGSTYYEDKAKYFERVEVLKAGCKEFRRVEVEGTHHVHIVRPEAIVDEINEFIRKHYDPR